MKSFFIFSTDMIVIVPASKAVSDIVNEQIDPRLKELL